MFAVELLDPVFCVNEPELELPVVVPPELPLEIVMAPVLQLPDVHTVGPEPRVNPPLAPDAPVPPVPVLTIMDPLEELADASPLPVNRSNPGEFPLDAVGVMT